MKVEKKLREESKRLDEQILEEGKELKSSLMQEYCIASETAVANKPTVQRKSLVITLCCVVGFLLVVGICFPIFLDKAPVYYLKENEVSSEISIEKIYDVVDFKINESSFVITRPTKVEDSVSNDLLFYSIKVDSTQLFPFGTVDFIVNKKYELINNDYDKTCIWNNGNVMYKTASSDMNSLPTIQVEGYFEHKNIRIHFAYTDIDLGETITPIGFLDSLFII